MHIVTGATGLLGSHLLFELCSKKMPVRALFRSQEKKEKVLKLFHYYDSDNAEQYFNSIEWVKGDVNDIPSLTELITPNSFVYHCAGYVSFDDKEFNQLIRVNREGTTNVINTCLDVKVEKLCHVSSTAAIGGNSGEHLTEKTKWESSPTTSGYSISKYNAEREVWRGIEEGLNAVIVNPCVILGAGQWDESSLTIFRTVQKGTNYYPPGANATVDARDVSSIMVQLMQSDIQSERFLCVGSNQTFKELLTVISKELHTKGPQKEAKKWMVKLAKSVLHFISLFTGKRPALNNNTVNSLFNSISYSSDKVQQALNFKFRNLEEQVQNSIKGQIKD